MRKKINVCLVTGELRYGGSERQLVELARSLDKDLYTAHVVTMTAGGPLEADVYDEPGIELHYLDSDGNAPAALSAIRRLAGVLRAEQVDILQPFNRTSVAIAAGLIARTPIKVALERGREPSGTAARFVGNRLARSADVVVANSVYGCELAESRGVRPEKVRMIEDGIPLGRAACLPGERRSARMALNIRADEPVVGIVANMTPEKDHESFLMAASIVKRHVPSTRFLIIGRGPLREELEERAAEFGLSGAAIFAGEKRQIVPYIGAMDVAVLTSLQGNGCPNFLIEAMGMARPIVATDTPGNRGLFGSGEAGLFVPAKDPVALATATLRVLTSPPIAQGLGERGRFVFQRRFNLRRMVEAYENLYDELLERKPGREPSTEAIDLERAA